jgi:two-component system, OmpR family, sensor histidine kinase SenX3
MARMTVVLALVVGILVVLLALASRSLRSARRDLRMVGEQLGGPGATPAAAESVATQREALAQTVQAVVDGVVVVDERGDDILRNRAGERFRRARHAEALVEDALRELLDRAREGEQGERELQLYGPPPEVLELRALPLRLGERRIGAVGFVRDISELRRVESVRRDFVANVSHELKTPIGALTLLAETMAADDDPVVIRQLAERVQLESDRLGRIVDDLLDLSLIEAQEAPSRGPVPVYVVLHEAVERVRASADARGIPIEISPVSADLEVVCDRSQLVSAVTNLLDNAVKYSDSDEPVELLASVEDGSASIAVRDHGIGIPKRDLERIFERFYRVDRARSRATGGTGLGLSIVRHIAQAHGGDVTVESIEGAGSTFRLRLPLAGGASRDLSEAS